ncbi:hypothetical protein CANARDRAFT_26117 [[Candida] arabinofermentans NRRL YB-2248]|uniref:Actin-related protein 5 n=1 Tax=[Candida] arabinofermentans NRRL YB-2248 TaxID=983967 RepID=A0A1E4T859_9ASCO|nr:hypothetical protein CANARDRAFT_26117 [[Candida] arabinofermentans NRRL YB-2248]
MDSAVLPPQKTYPLEEMPLPVEAEPFYNSWQQGSPIVIDFGRSSMRVGLSPDNDPKNVFPSLIARYRDRKVNKTLTLCGKEVFVDSGMRSNIRTPFDGSMITNWDYVETLLDYSFSHLGVNSDGGVDSPVLMTEVLATPYQQRSTMMELLFETYNVPAATFGCDSLFSFHQNKGKTGLVIGTGHEATHIIPVVNHKPLLSLSKRIDWGGRQTTNYMSEFLSLKYPYFPTKITNSQVDRLIKNHCYISKDYNEEISNYLSLENLEKKDIVLEAPFTEFIKPVKTEEELQIEAEKRRETIKKLQEQAQQKRLEKLVEKEADYTYYTELKEKMKKMNKRELIEVYRNEGFDGEADLNKHMASLERSLKKARNQDIGENENENEPPSWPLIDIPDADLDEEQIKEKRKQRLMKSNYDARQRAKLEKEVAAKEAEEAALKDKQLRETDLQSWIGQRRERLEALIKKVKDRKKMKEELSDRKSRAAQIRMRNIASLASDDSGGANGRKKKASNVTIDNDPNDTFGADDSDWAVYRDIANPEDDDVEEEEEQEIYKIEEELLEFDPNFTVEDTLQRQYDWRRSVIHRFLRGPRDTDAEDQHQQHQIHLNIERIRVPEILFQPSIAGVDQAGITEISESIILKRLPSELGFSGDDRDELLNNIFITGGQSLFQNFEERLYNDFRAFLPVGTNLRIRRAEDPLLDAWRGMSSWAKTPDFFNSCLKKKEYEEYGVDYIKENNLGLARL